jgi:hypothetical protein
MTAIRRQLGSPAMIVACVALIVALSGVSYAAAVLPKNSIGTAQLQKKAVTGKKIAKNAVTGPKVANGTLMAADFKASQLPSGPQGSKGDPGPKGDKGDKGDTGAPGLSGWQFVVDVQPTLAPGAKASASALCPDGKKVLGGGFHVPDNFSVTESRGMTFGGAWEATVRNNGLSGAVWSVYSVCANVSS